MTITTLKQLFGLKSLIPKFFASLTLLWLVVEPIAVFQKLPNSWYGYASLLATSFIAAIIWNWPKAVIKHRFSHNDLTVRVVKGDVLDARTNIVIGFCDTFDTQIGNIIRDTSLQGQFQRQIFGGDIANLDLQLESLLEPEKKYAIHDPDKSAGKHLRFPVGTTLTLHQGKRYFLFVYTRMGNDLACIPTPAEDITTALYKLWAAVRRNGQNEKVSIPIVASDLARSGLSRTTLMKMIMLTFYTSHVSEPVTKALDIYVHPADTEHVDFNAIKSFLKHM